MSKLLFIITSSENLGDLALCQEWIEALNRDENSFGFVVSRGLKRFISEQDTLYFYEYYIDVRSSILEAYRNFKPDAIIFASNSFWNLPGHFGARFGQFTLRPNDVEVPVLSFDPFEIGIKYEMHHSQDTIHFSSVPSWVWALQYMSTIPRAANAVHFAMKQKAYSSQHDFRNEIITKWGGDINRKSIFFPISQNRWFFIKKNFPMYYEHIARIFEQIDGEFQIFVLSPKHIVEFAHREEVIQLPLLEYYDFHELVASVDLYITDSYISCIFNAFMLGIPTILLNNSEASRGLKEGSFLESNFFPYKVFPYGLTAAANKLESIWETKGCYLPLEVLDVNVAISGINNMIYPSETRDTILSNCRDWRDRHRSLPTPAEALQDILARPSRFPADSVNVLES